MNKTGTSPALTSPAASGVFLFPSSQRCNRPAQAPPFAFKGRLPSALPLSAPCRPAWPKLGRFAAPSALAVRPPLVILARPAPCRFPCPVPPFAAPCGASPSLAPSAAPPPLAWSNPCRRPYAGPAPPRKSGNRPPRRLFNAPPLPHL